MTNPETKGEEIVENSEAPSNRNIPTSTDPPDESAPPVVSRENQAIPTDAAVVPDSDARSSEQVITSVDDNETSGIVVLGVGNESGDEFPPAEFPTASDIQPHIVAEEKTSTRTNASKGSAVKRSKQKAVAAGMPSALRSIVFHSPQSLIYKTLDLVPVPPLEESERSALVRDLKEYVRMCTERGFVHEAAYVQAIVPEMKRICSPRKIDMRGIRVREDLEAAETEVRIQQEYWDSQVANANLDFRVSLADAELRYERDVADLDQEWASPAKQKKYSKPSVEILNSRCIAQQLVKVKRFEDAALVGKSMTALMEQESGEAARQMNVDYRKADARLRQRFEAEGETLRLANMSRLNAIACSREKSLKPLHQRCQLLREMHEARVKEQNRPRPETVIAAPKVMSGDNELLASIHDAPALRLPPIKPIMRAKSGLRPNMKGGKSVSSSGKLAPLRR